MKTGLYIGRFQPFHLGHLSAIQQALKNVDRLYIAIGSSQVAHLPDNPFTAEERAEMIHLSLKENKLEDFCEIFEIPDIHDDARWTAHVRSIVPPFDVVFIGNRGIVKELFEKENKTPVTEIEHEIDISATHIRRMMKEAQDWGKYVSPSVVDYLSSISASPGHK